MEKRGKTESEAISMAVGIVRNWAEGKGNVDATTRAAARLALEEWERKRAQTHAKVKEAAERAVNGVLEARLSMKERKNLNKSDFAIPEKAPGPGSYPIHDRTHAEKALQLCGGKPEESRVRSAVFRKYPDMKKPKNDKVKEAVMAVLEGKRDASASDSHRNVKCPKCDTVQSATHTKCSECGHDLTDARKAKFANSSASS